MVAAPATQLEKIRIFQAIQAPWNLRPALAHVSRPFP
jgi:hypothetical protein